MKVVVTGGAGFIGSHLAAYLSGQGYEVAAIDCFHPYYPTERKERQFQALTGGRVPLVRLDLLDGEQTKQWFAQFRPDVVYHLAALPGVPYSLEQPLTYIDYDIKATVNVLAAAGEAEARHVLFASSSSVYGDRGNVPLKEEMADGRVVSPYAAAKYGAESFCHAYAHLHGYKMTIFRYFTVYGPWGRPDMAIGAFLRRLMNGEEITVYGSGTARDYTYIDDIVAGMVAALGRSGSQSEVFNLGAGTPVTMEQLLVELRRHFPDMKVVRAPERKGDVKATWADITKAKRAFGYEPKVPFFEGLARTVAWAREHER
ncbi:UDP-glucose 4-epimerase [Geobacillus sp. 46C-IIa]|uniref:NAD-dependent epimerase/dehydratase family protein n=1 Tax=Geobacillus sp. 46C-IIa TaxID=1963025 RepID=UPI0009BCEDD0|nr:NAD-dependent epimerase/dehydratase family protein [Geobacillus sp. 46C-IIa]OQP06383.1 UDP-glucose 4-epimerase [Geobacillus sp. 46C-IIa]QNU28627.1 NAD-dependent epimerase/dehydratase family protein [Geobacillus sp. 46C-IIa]